MMSTIFLLPVSSFGIPRLCRTSVISGLPLLNRHPIGFRSVHSASTQKSPTNSINSISSAASNSSHSRLNFDDVELSFQSKSSAELFRALLVYRICTIRSLVANADQLLKLSQRILGSTITNKLLKATFFGQFAAGENAEEIIAVVDELESVGLGGILDYAAEADVSTAKGGTGHSTGTTTITISNNITTTSISPTADQLNNTELFASSIVAAGSRHNGFAAIKVTAMGSPDLLITITEHILYHKRLFHAITSNHAISHSQIPRIDPQTTISLQELESALQQHQLKLSDSNKQELLHNMDMYEMKVIDYTIFAITFSPFSSTMANSLIAASAPSIALSSTDLTQFAELHSRTDQLAELALQHKVNLLVDAEQTYLQPAIDLLVLSMQQIANKQTAYVLNTYQCYLKDTYSRLILDLQQAKREGWKMGAKVVRGAYMRQERARSLENQYEDPIQPTKEKTNQHYHQLVAHLLNLISSSPASNSPSLVIAGHNEGTIKWATELMSSSGLSGSDRRVTFGQLFGMCDHVSYSLAQCGYRVVKVCPYGPIQEVLPYLIRRAQENADVLERATKERRLVSRELWRRTRTKFLPVYIIPIAIGCTVLLTIMSL